MVKMNGKTRLHQAKSNTRRREYLEALLPGGQLFSEANRTGKKGLRALLSGLILVSLVGLILALAAPALADAGPFPTRTPTQTATLIATVAIPTPIVLTIIPSLNPQQNLPEATQPLPVGGDVPVVDPQTGAQEGEDAPAPSAALACWPIAIILILAILVGGSYVLSHGRD